MTVSNSRLSFEDCFDYFDAALADDKGIRVPCDDFGDAKQLQLRCNKARALDREENKETYEPGHVLYGRSEYDRIMARIVRNGEGVFLYFERKDKKKLNIESLSELEPEQENMIPGEWKEEEEEPTVVQRIERRVI